MKHPGPMSKCRACVLAAFCPFALSIILIAHSNDLDNDLRWSSLLLVPFFSLISLTFEFLSDFLRRYFIVAGALYFLLPILTREIIISYLTCNASCPKVEEFRGEQQADIDLESTEDAILGNAPDGLGASGVGRQVGNNLESIEDVLSSNAPDGAEASWTGRQIGNIPESTARVLLGHAPDGAEASRDEPEIILVKFDRKRPELKYNVIYKDGRSESKNVSSQTTWIKIQGELKFLSFEAPGLESLVLNDNLEEQTLSSNAGKAESLIPSSLDISIKYGSFSGFRESIGLNPTGKIELNEERK